MLIVGGTTMCDDEKREVVGGLRCGVGVCGSQECWSGFLSGLCVPLVGVCIPLLGVCVPLRGMCSSPRCVCSSPRCVCVSLLVVCVPLLGVCSSPRCVCSSLRCVFSSPRSVFLSLLCSLLSWVRSLIPMSLSTSHTVISHAVLCLLSIHLFATSL